MKTRRTAQLRHRVASMRRISVSALARRSLGEGGFFNLRALITLLVCGAAACSMLSGALLAFFRPEAPSTASQRTLTFAQRVAYQRAIEEVYWCHRIWPKERPDRKPSLDAVMSQAQLEKKVEDYLRKSEVLEDYQHHPITAKQLQAEIDRMAQHTKQSGVLRELFEALGNDPFIIAECLARPILSERLKSATVELGKGPLDFWRAGAENQMPKPMAAVSGNYTLPVIARPSGGCTDDTWTPTSTTNAPAARWYHTTVWTGSEMIVWGGAAGPTYFNTGGRYNPVTDSWTATSTTNAPAARAYHTAVWTGGEMIVWGGLGDAGYLNTGGRYNPSTDGWTATNTTNAPAAREYHTAVWTGSQMIVWGGSDGSSYFNTGGRYNLSTDSWATTSTNTAPDGRYLHTALWTGSEMIVWAGLRNTGYLNTGGRYNPSTDGWTATSIINAPAARQDHRAVWTGGDMIVWGGYFYDGSGHYLNTGGRYNPGADSWTATSTTDAPDGRYNHTAVWTGSQMIVWGGFNYPTGFLNTGGRYNPITDSWTVTSTTNAPDARDRHTAVWTGSQMIVWGGGGYGIGNTGGRYCAAAPGATPTPTPTPTPIACFLFENFDNVTPPTLPPGWTAINAINPDGIFWQTSNSGLPSPPADSPPNAAWVNDPAAISDKYLDSPPIRIDLLENAGLTFRNNYALENTFDGGVLEVSIDGGPFQDILAAGGFFGQGGYNGTISACCGNPLAGRNAWTGSSGGFIETDVSLQAFQGHTIVLRWRMGSDSSGSGEGWRVDSVWIICERPTPTPTATSTPMVTATPTATATATATATSTPRPTPTARPEPTPRPRSTPAPRP